MKTIYDTPDMRVVEICFDRDFLASNTEPIDGGDSPDIEW